MRAPGSRARYAMICGTSRSSQPDAALVADAHVSNTGSSLSLHYLIICSHSCMLCSGHRDVVSGNLNIFSTANIYIVTGPSCWSILKAVNHPPISISVSGLYRWVWLSRSSTQILSPNLTPRSGSYAQAPELYMVHRSPAPWDQVYTLENVVPAPTTVGQPPRKDPQMEYSKIVPQNEQKYR
ncbi:hypothetical protein Tco_1153810 [Tanacetum coccineum]